MISSSRGDARSLDKEVHRIIKRCTLAKFSQFFREIGSFLPFSGNLWGARAPSAPPLTAPLTAGVSALSKHSPNKKRATMKVGSSKAFIINRETHESSTQPFFVHCKNTLRAYEQF